MPVVTEYCTQQSIPDGINFRRVGADGVRIRLVAETRAVRATLQSFQPQLETQIGVRRVRDKDRACGSESPMVDVLERLPLVCFRYGVVRLDV